jgi:hypothetical protein
MKILSVFLLLITLSSNAQMQQLNALVNNWHKSAAEANYTKYTEVMSEKFVFLGTAPGERWNKTTFLDFCNPYFEKGKAWDFTATNRMWEFNKDSTVAWFDEDLDTWMRGCRGSGILEKENGIWKLSYYNLTVLIENEKIKNFIELRDEKEEPLRPSR